MSTWKMTAMKSTALALVAATALAGCSSGNGNNNQASNNTGAASPEPTSSAAPSPAASAAPSEQTGWQVGSEPLEYSMYGHYDWYTMPKWGGDVSSKWIMDNMKVNVTGIQSGGNAAQKLNTMIASGKLPDVIWLDKGADVEKLREADMLVPFDDYIEKYPNFKKWVGQKNIDMLRSSDGKIYQFPNWYNNQPFGNAGYLVNKKYYEALGSPKLETTDDFYNYLKAVKEKFPKVVPFNPDLAVDGQGLDVLYSAFKEDANLATISNRVAVTGDKLTSIFKDPVYRESMLYSSKLFREKLMSQDAMTQKKDQVKEKAFTGQAAVFAGASPTEYGSAGDAELKKKDPQDGYFMIWPVHKDGLNKDKIFPGTYTGLGWNVSVITKSAKDPEKIFSFLDWLTGPEGTRTLMWGPEGMYWEGHDEDGAPKFNDAYLTDVDGRAKVMDATVNLQWVGNSAFMDNSKMKFESSLPDEKKTWETRYQSSITWKTQADATQFLSLAPAPNSEEGIVQTSLEEIWDESRAKALYAKSDEEVLAILDKADKDAMAIGYQSLLDFKTKKWQENLKVLGN